MEVRTGSPVCLPDSRSRCWRWIMSDDRRLRVWAPDASTMEVSINDVLFPMEREQPGSDDRGYWTLGDPQDGTPIRDGDRYAFSVDGGPLRPDPRSRRQPDGVHAPSQWTVRAPESMPAGYAPPAWATAVVYELHIGTFSTDASFDGAIGHLDDLVALGVTYVDVMPVASASGARGWGYDGVALYSVSESYGGPDGLRRFVAACHERGLGVLMDVVYNHLGPEGNYLGEFGPYFTDAYRTPWGSAINLDGSGSDEVRSFLIDNARQWMRDYGCDGLRIDAVHALYDHTAYHFLEELSVATERLSVDLGRSLVLVAESDSNDPRLVTPRAYGGYGIDAQWSDDFHHALHVALTGEQHGYYAGFAGIDDLATSLRDVYVHAGDHAQSRGRRHGRPVANLPGERFLAYSQNHDQVGNRGQGERMCHLVDPERAKIAAALTILSPMVPMLFQGEEWAASTPFLYFTDHGDPALAQAVREGRRREFSGFGLDPDQIPDPQEHGTYRASVLDWTERSRSPHADMLEWYTALLALRREEADLRYADRTRVSVECDSAAGWLHLRRGCIHLHATFIDAPVVLPVLAAGQALTPLLHSANARHEHGRLCFDSPGVAIYRR
ncbi:MAG: malto-oligosyltrehalose trehalohydrolase [Spirochaetaceae bacterium]|nr:MAG: malto-oligosyltrehalose trehalohydrolase [Spirochaetaceae bacterium]